jgi:patatin-like phospholipase/acyl hydrolase
MSKLTRVLSIDGGGIRGIIPAEVLFSLERKLQERTGNPDIRIADCFDLIAGSSTGGILTCIFLCPDKEHPGRPRFTAEDALDLYLKKGDKIFDISLWQRITAGFGLLDEKYSADNLEKELDYYLEDLRLSDLLKPTLITSYDIQKRCAKFFTQHDAVKTRSENYYLKDVARATSAAPTYFETKGVKSLSSTFYPLIDGGVFANNPTLCAYAEVRNKFPDRPRAKDMAILSIGTGYDKKVYEFEKAKDWGMMHWVKPLFDIMLSGVAETVDYQLRQIYDAVGQPDQYLRVDGKMRNANPDLDNASAENLLALQKNGKRIAKEFDERLDSFIEHLID